MGFFSKLFGKKDDAPVAPSIPATPPESVTNENPATSASATPSEFAPTQPTSPPAVSSTPEASTDQGQATDQTAPVESVPTDGVVAQPPEVMPSPNNSSTETTDPNNTPPANPVA